MAFVRDDTARVPFDGRGVRILSIELLVLDGPARGQRIAIRESTARVGSAEGNQLVLADKTVSMARQRARAPQRHRARRDARTARPRQ